MPPKAPTDRGPLAPETHNAEQDDEGAQAQSVAEDAIDHATNMLGLEDSEKVASTDPAGDDSGGVQDLVDHMRQMDTSGRIDMSAFSGERNDDDDEDRYGEAADDN